MNAQEALLVAVIGSVLVAVALAALAVASLRGLSRDRALTLFGVFVALYGVRLLAQSPLVGQTTGLPERWFWFASAWITYAILAPASMFIGVFAAPAFRVPLRRVWQADLVYAAVAIASDVVAREPGSALWLNPVAVFSNFAVALICLIGSSRIRRHDRSHRPPRRGAIAAAIGAACFTALAGYQTAFDRSPVSGVTSLEPVGMLALIIGLGYFVAERAIDSEQRLLALSLELQTARRIQQSILPTKVPSLPALAVVARYLPMAEVAGDFYDFLEGGDGRLGILVADVSGHGVPAAMIASMVKIALAAQAEHADDPALVVTGMNRALCGKFELAYVTATYAFLDPARERLMYAAAGHPPILLLRAGGEIEPLREGGLVLGFNPDSPYATASVRIDAGDRLLLYTDGLLEAEDQHGAFFGDARLFESLRAVAAADLRASVDQLVDDLNTWRGRNSPLTDDVTIVAVALDQTACSVQEGTKGAGPAGDTRRG